MGLLVNEILTPGDFVHHPNQKDWGLGQVQSVIDGKITVNFEHAGKVVIDGTRVVLRLVIDKN
jgi:hypothetical protein